MTSENTRYKMEIITENLAVIVTGISGLLIGLSPTIKDYLLSKTKWKTEKVSVEAQTLDTMMRAAGELSKNSERQIEMAADIINLYEDALGSQKQMTVEAKQMAREEKELRVHYHSEIETLRTEMVRISDNVVSCSKELVLIVSDLNQGIHIEKSRLDNLEANWK